MPFQLLTIVHTINISLKPIYKTTFKLFDTQTICMVMCVYFLVQYEMYTFNMSNSPNIAHFAGVCFVNLISYCQSVVDLLS
jgi:hypothetical protein